MRRRIGVSYILCFVAACALNAYSHADAQEKPANPIEVHVDSLLASDTHGGMDASLISSPLARRLGAVFDYSTYHLLKHQDEETACGEAVAFNLPGGRILHVAPLEVEGNMIAMELVLFEGAHAMLRTELRMVQNGALILVGPRNPEQTFITTIAVERRISPKEASPPTVSPEPDTALDLNPATPPE